MEVLLLPQWVLSRLPRSPATMGDEGSLPTSVVGETSDKCHDYV